MTRRLLPLLLLALLNCSRQHALLPADALESRATLYGDSRAGDGCDAHLGLAPPISDALRLPTPATRPLMDKVIQAETRRAGQGYWMGSKAVTIRYRETGQMATLVCGWGRTQTVKTIELLGISE